MILTIDLNPSINREYVLDNLSLGRYNLTNSTSFKNGGSGMIATTLFNTFSQDSILTGFLGGINGEYFHKELRELGIAHEFTQITEETRTTISIIDQENYTSISDYGPRVNREELINFYELYTRLIYKTDIICGLGVSLPLGAPKDIYYDLIKYANKNNKKFILDIKGEELNYSIDASPYMVILDQEELENLIKLSLNFENEIIKGGRYILDKGVEFVVIDLQNKGSIVLGQKQGYRIEIPYTNKNNTSKDHSGFAAGFALGLNRGYDLDMTLRLGQAFDIASNLEQNTSNIEMSDVKRIMGEIEIYPINY